MLMQRIYPKFMVEIVNARVDATSLTVASGNEPKDLKSGKDYVIETLFHEFSKSNEIA
jgi:hypothetical protein